MQFSSSTERLAKFRWCIAKGRHLFPFRTEQLSLSAPMVLGGQPPGRVGRRRFFFAARALNGRGLRSFMGALPIALRVFTLLSHGEYTQRDRSPGRTGSGPVPGASFRAAPLPRGRQLQGAASLSRCRLEAVVIRHSVEETIATPPPRHRARIRGRAAVAGFAARGGSPNGLEPVLAERGEVDHQVDGVGQPCR